MCVCVIVFDGNRCAKRLIYTKQHHHQLHHPQNAHSTRPADRECILFSAVMFVVIVCVCGMCVCVSLCVCLCARLVRGRVLGAAPLMFKWKLHATSPDKHTDTQSRVVWNKQTLYYRNAAYTTQQTLSGSLCHTQFTHA